MPTLKAVLTIVAGTIIASALVKQLPANIRNMIN